MSQPDVVFERRPLPLQEVGEKWAALVTLNRPESLNPIDSDVLATLDGILNEIESAKHCCTVLVTGAGRAFSAGGDLKGYIELQRDPVRFPKFVAYLHQVFGRLRQLPVPVVALVNGVTAAGGLELLLNCDLALVARSARIGDGHLNFGQMGGGGVLTLLPRAIGPARAAELIFSGRFLSAPEAVEYGLAARVVDDDALLDEGLAFAASVAVKSPLAVANAKEVLQSLWAANGDIEAGLRFERERTAFYCLTSHDAPEGLKAFAEKRAPRFEGR